MLNLKLSKLTTIIMFVKISLLYKKIVYALIPFTYLFLLLFQKDISMFADLGRHLKLGEVIVGCRCVPEVNLFSYTYPNFPIVNHEWLAEVIFYVTSSWFGLHALLVLKMILIIITASLLYSTALKKGSLFWVTIFSIFSITVFSTRFYVLPELFSYLFVGIFIFLIEKYKETRKIALLWILPFIELFWVNMHIYYIIGVGMYGLFFIEDFIKNKKLDLKLVGVGITLILSVFLNPKFIQGAILPFTVFNNYGFNVEENISTLKFFNPTSTNTNIAYTLTMQVIVFEVLIMLFIFLLFFKHLWKNIFQLGNGIFAAILGLKFVRAIGVFAILGYISLVQSFTYIENRLRKKDEDLTVILKLLFAIVAGVVILIHVVGLFQYKILSFSYVPSTEKALEFIKETELKGPIFNNYRIGNHLIYGLYPKEKVYIDARPEAYPASFFKEYLLMMTDEQYFNQQVKKYDINAVVFDVTDDPVVIRPFLLRLIQSPDWIPVYGDGSVTIFVRNIEVNQKIIDKYKIVLDQ